MRFGKVLCKMLLVAILGVYPAQNLAKYKMQNGWLYIVKEHKPKDVQGQGPSNKLEINLIFCCVIVLNT